MAGKEKIHKTEILNRCALENNISINCNGAIAFFEYLELVYTVQDTIVPSDSLHELAGKNNNDIINNLVITSINKLIGDGIFNKDATGFDLDRGSLIIKHSAFPLSYAAIRNFLIHVGVLNKEENGKIFVEPKFEQDIIKSLRGQKEKFTLEQLIKQQEEQNKRGLEAEEFVLAYEKARLPLRANKIKRISDLDVTAGYDIVSFEDECAECYNRFIEVKCYKGAPHFYWSENESDVAKVLEDKYILCLVNHEKIGEHGYQPEFIRNPYESIFNGDGWMVNPSSYRIQKI